MINSSQKLNPKLFDKDVEQEPIRAGFGHGLLEAARSDERVVGLCADLTESTKMDVFKKEFPKRFIEIGVAEQNLAAVASGMAAMGKVPFLSSYAVFSPGRNWEQIRTTICYNDRNVKIVGSHAGVSVGPDGGSHQALEDIAIMRALPRMRVLVPCDSIEAKKATEAAAKNDGPIYLRLAREKTPVVTTAETPFEFGKANLLWDSEKPSVAIIACGPMVYNSLVAAKSLAEEGIEVLVLNLHTIKPMDKEAVIEVAKRAGRVVTVEEHQVMGGMGSAVAEVLASNFPVPIEFIGVQDKFGQSGTPTELVEFYGMGVKSIVEVVKKITQRK
ncbi:MAG: transketolase family protein [Candidatus Vogelbacteria bacterium]|nr:transketolase family protein [Candidatus Vogelbacteria bacterium]